MESDHWEALHHGREDLADQTSRVASQLLIVRIEALQESLHYLNQEAIKVVLRVAADEVLQHIQHVVLVFRTVFESSRMLIYHLEKVFCKVRSNLKESLGCR